MAIVQAYLTPISLDPNEIDLGQIANGGETSGGAFLSRPTVGSASSTHLQLVYKINGGPGVYTWDLDGVGLTYFPAGASKGSPAPDISGGTLTHMADHVNGGFGSADISGFSVPAATFWSQAKVGDNLGILSSILAGDDTINGSDARINSSGELVGDHLLGYAGNDVINGGAGFDRLQGGAGNDFLNGGADTDTAEYSGPSTAYKIVTYAGTTGVIANPAVSAEGSDRLVSVEQIAFSDQTLAPPPDNFDPLIYIASNADLIKASAPMRMRASITTSMPARTKDVPPRRSTRSNTSRRTPISSPLSVPTPMPAPPTTFRAGRRKDASSPSTDWSTSLRTPTSSRSFTTR